MKKENEYVNQDLLIKNSNIENEKNELSLKLTSNTIQREKEEENFKALSNLNEEIMNNNQTLKIQIAQIESSSQLEIIELINTIEELKNKSNNIESQNELLQDGNTCGKKSKIHSKRGCTFPSCNGKGNISESFN